MVAEVDVYMLRCWSWCCVGRGGTQATCWLAADGVAADEGGAALHVRCLQAVVLKVGQAQRVCVDEGERESNTEDE